MSGAREVLVGTEHGHDSSSFASSPTTSSRVLNHDLARVKTAFEQTVADIRRMQANSHVTRAEVEAVDHDLAEWPHPPGTSIAAVRQFPDANSAEYGLGVQIDYMYLDGSLTARGWSDIKSDILADLNVLSWSVPEAEIDQTLADMETLAQSAGVTRREEINYLDDGLAIAADLGPTDDVPRALDPTVYLSTHLAGFIHRS